MTRILFIAYHFPPVGGAGVQRAAKFARYLVGDGFMPVVVTGPGPDRDRWTPEDASLLDEVPKEVPIHRLAAPASGDGATASQRAVRAMGFGTPFPAWWAKALLAEGESIGRREQVRLVFATMSPFETAAPAAELARRLGVPWVADLRDPWALDETMIHPTRLHLAVERRAMRSALATASAVVMNTPEATARLKIVFPEYRSRRVATITNGFDADDFQAPVAQRTDGLFTIVHAGYLHTEAGEELRDRSRLLRARGGVAPGLDILTRSHVFLLRALEAWMREDAEAAAKVRLVLIGGMTARDRAVIDASPVAKCVVTPGYQSHAETLRQVRTADLLFLPMHNLPEGTRATIVPGKTYEYMASGRRVLAALPDGDARDFLERAGNGIICRPDDVQGLTRGLKKAFEAWRQDDQPAAPAREFLAQFERRSLTRQLAVQFRVVLQSAPARAGAT